MLPRAITGRLGAIGIRSRPLSLSTHKANSCYRSRSASAASQNRTSAPGDNNSNSHGNDKHRSIGNNSGSSSSSCSTRHSFRQPHTTADCCGGTAAIGQRQRWQHRREFSAAGRRVVAPAAPSSEFAQLEEEEEEGRQGVGGREKSAVVGDLSSLGGTEIDADDAGDDTPAAAGLRLKTAPASTPLDLGCKAYYMARNIGIRAVCTVRAVNLFVFLFWCCGAAVLRWLLFFFGQRTA